MMMKMTILVLGFALVSCGSDNESPGNQTLAWQELYPDGMDPFADSVHGFIPDPFANFGHTAMPNVVLGAPEGGGDTAGSTDVVSLGKRGVIVLALDDVEAVDGPGVDILVFENPFANWIESGEVSVSPDGVTWRTWKCNPTDNSGCAGVQPVYANSDNQLDPTDPEVAGGDGFDLADVGLDSARLIQIEDTGANDYAGAAAGFDLDAVAVVNGRVIE